MLYEARSVCFLAVALLLVIGHGLEVTYPNASVTTIDISTPLHIRWKYDSNDPPVVNIGLQYEYFFTDPTWPPKIQTPGQNASTKDQHYMVDWQQSTDWTEIDVGMECAVVIYTGIPLKDTLLAHSPWLFVVDGGEANGDPLATSSMTMTILTTTTETVSSSSQQNTMTATVTYGSLDTKSGPYVIATASTKTLSFDVPGQDSSYTATTSPPAPPNYTSFFTYGESQLSQWERTQTDYNLTSLSECFKTNPSSYFLCTSSTAVSSTPTGTITFSVSSGILVPVGQSPTNGSAGEQSSLAPSDSGALATISAENSESQSTMTETNSMAASSSDEPSRAISSSKASKGKKVPVLELICACGTMAAAVVIVLVSELLSLGWNTVARRY